MNALIASVAVALWDELTVVYCKAERAVNIHANTPAWISATPRPDSSFSLLCRRGAFRRVCTDPPFEHTQFSVLRQLASWLFELVLWLFTFCHKVLAETSVCAQPTAWSACTCLSCLVGSFSSSENPQLIIMYLIIVINLIHVISVIEE